MAERGPKPHISGMQDRSLELDAKGVEDILERTDIVNQQYSGLRAQWDTYTREELLAIRNRIKDVSQPKHHPKTPLPNPRQ